MPLGQILLCNGSFEVLAEEDYQSPSNNDPSRINWTRKMDRSFIDLMLEQLHRGNKIG